MLAPETLDTVELLDLLERIETDLAKRNTNRGEKRLLAGIARRVQYIKSRLQRPSVSDWEGFLNAVLTWPEADPIRQFFFGDTGHNIDSPAFGEVLQKSVLGFAEFTGGTKCRKS